MPGLLFLVSLLVFLISCAAGGRLETYEPKSPAEAEIKKSLIDFEDAYNSRDLNRCLSHAHENISYETTSGSWASKEELPDTLEWEWGIGVRIQYTTPDIALDEKQAVVKISSPWESNMGQSGFTQNTYTMVLEGDRWLTIKRERR
jgi:hypothetical protein